MEDCIEYYSYNKAKNTISEYLDMGGDVVNLCKPWEIEATWVCTAPNTKVCIIQSHHWNKHVCSYTLNYYDELPEQYKKDWRLQPTQEWEA